jgi:hypothetical protein
VSKTLGYFIHLLHGLQERTSVAAAKKTAFEKIDIVWAVKYIKSQNYIIK